jgi:hypothetical protein
MRSRRRVRQQQLTADACSRTCWTRSFRCVPSPLTHINPLSPAPLLACAPHAALPRCTPRTVFYTLPRESVKCLSRLAWGGSDRPTHTQFFVFRCIFEPRTSFFPRCVLIDWTLILSPCLTMHYAHDNTPHTHTLILPQLYLFVRAGLASPTRVQANRSDYEILNEIGAGSSSTVYKVQCKGLIWRCPVSPSLPHTTGCFHSRAAMAIRDQPWPFVTSHGHRWPAMAIRDQPWPFVTSHGHRWPAFAKH